MEHPTFRVQDSQRGFTLIELMVAMLIAVFLLGGLLTIVQANRAVFGDQSQMAQLQDGERMAMTMMADVIQSAGYFPSPTSNTSTGSLVAAGSFVAGQSIYGTYSSAVPGDSISIRYVTASSVAGSGDGILNCSGTSNTTGVNTLYTNVFQVVGGQLVCTMNGTQYNLVSGVTNTSTTLGVTNLRVLYGVKANAAATGNNVDTYQNATQVTAGSNWNNVISVLVIVTFTNPLYSTGQTTQPATVSIQRVINVMNQVGPTL